MNRHLPSASPAGGPHLGLPRGLCKAVIWRKRRGWEGWGPHPGAEASEGPCVPAEDSGLGTPGAPLHFRRQDAHRNRGAERGKLGTPDPPQHLVVPRLVVPKAPPTWTGRRLPGVRRRTSASATWAGGGAGAILRAGPHGPGGWAASCASSRQGQRRAGGSISGSLGSAWVGSGAAAGSTWLGVSESVWGGSGRQGSGSEQGSGSGAQCPSARRNGWAPGSPVPGSEGLPESRSEAGPGSRRRHAPQLAAGGRRGGPIEGEQRARPRGQGVAGRRPLPGEPALFTLPEQSGQYSD